MIFTIIKLKTINYIQLGHSHLCENELEIDILKIFTPLRRWMSQSDPDDVNYEL